MSKVEFGFRSVYRKRILHYRRMMLDLNIPTLSAVTNALLLSVAIIVRLNPIRSIRFS